MNDTDIETEESVDDPFRLDRVVMPVVLVMNHASLTWAQREACASAIQESLRKYKQLMEEHAERAQPVEKAPRRR